MALLIIKIITTLLFIGIAWHVRFTQICEIAEYGWETYYLHYQEFSKTRLYQLTSKVVFLIFSIGALLMCLSDPSLRNHGPIILIGFCLYTGGLIGQIIFLDTPRRRWLKAVRKENKIKMEAANAFHN